MSLRAGLWLLLFVGLSACATQRPYTPGFLLPSGTTVSDSTLIAYRTLTVDDFKAPSFEGTKPPDQEGDVGAATAVLIDTTPCRIWTLFQSSDDSTYYEAFVDTFVYQARFDQAHSWFNPGYKAEAGPLLEHEQIHFAISELMVRRANAEFVEISERIRSRHRDRMGAVCMAEERYLAELKRVRSEARARQNLFDRETENGTHLGESKYWASRIGRELKATADKKP